MLTKAVIALASRNLTSINQVLVSLLVFIAIPLPLLYCCLKQCDNEYRVGERIDRNRISFAIKVEER